MNDIKYQFTDHWGGTFPDCDIKLYEAAWNDYGFNGNFEVQFMDKLGIKYDLKDKWLRISRVDGTKMKRLSMHEIYCKDNTCIKINKYEYISFPSKNLCIALLLNFNLEERKKISEDLCFNFASGPEFERFKLSNMYKDAILRFKDEEIFIEEMKERELILFSALPINDWLSNIM